MHPEILTPPLSPQGRFAKPAEKKKQKAFEWSRSVTLALALNTCTQCHGGGLRPAPKGEPAACKCVLRSIFRICFDSFMRCATQERHLSRVSLGNARPGKSRPGTWGRKDEEFIADFYLVSQRVLDAFERRLFRYHFLLGADWKLCARQLGIDRGTFFHAVYRIEEKLGKVFAELQPYALYPLSDYFNGPSRMELTIPRLAPEQRRPMGLPSAMPVGIPKNAPAAPEPDTTIETAPQPQEDEEPQETLKPATSVALAAAAV